VRRERAKAFFCQSPVTVFIHSWEDVHQGYFAIILIPGTVLRLFTRLCSISWLGVSLETASQAMSASMETLSWG
jgi:hypothetical protein